MTLTNFFRPIVRKSFHYLLINQPSIVSRKLPVVLTASRCITSTPHRMLTITEPLFKDYNNSKEPDDKVISEESLLNNDKELSSILSDIMRDFDDSPPPTEPNGGSKIPGQALGSLNTANDKPNDESGLVEDPDEKKLSHGVSPGIQKKFQAYYKVKHEEILDADEELQQPEFFLYQKKNDKLKNVKLERGVEGVIDTHELVELLKGENMKDIVVIEIPKSFRYCDHMIVSTGLSTRHLKAVSEFLIKVYKLKKWNKDKFIPIEGEQSNDWKVLDMGNVVIHLFLEETRANYDLETLWTVGTEFDDLSCKVEDPLEDLLQQHIQYLDSVKMSSRA